MCSMIRLHGRINSVLSVVRESSLRSTKTGMSAVNVIIWNLFSQSQNKLLRNLILRSELIRAFSQYYLEF